VRVKITAPFLHSLGLSVGELVEWIVRQAEQILALVGERDGLRAAVMDRPGADLLHEEVGRLGHERGKSLRSRQRRDLILQISLKVEECAFDQTRQSFRHNPRPCLPGDSSAFASEAGPEWSPKQICPQPLFTGWRKAGRLKS